MSSFTEARLAPTGTQRRGRPLYQAERAFTFHIGYVGSGLAVTVPAGFVTDGPSVPRWIAWALPLSTMTKSSAVHDRLREDTRYSKIEGDAIFLTAMAVEGTPRWLRELAFLAVRLNNSRRDHQAGAPPG